MVALSRAVAGGAAAVDALLQSKVLWVGLGGAAGSVSRYLLAGAVQRLSATLFPIGTMAVNVTGCLLIGFLSIRTEASVLAPHHRLALLVGFLGGFTTFSTFSLETLQLFERRETAAGLTNVAASVVVCLTACWLGQRIARGFQV